MKTKDELPECPVATAVTLIGGKWKLLILRNLKVRPWRFNELQRDLEGISQKVLTDSLRQMIDDGLAYRHDYHEMPPRVEYASPAACAVVTACPPSGAAFWPQPAVAKKIAAHIKTTIAFFFMIPSCVMFLLKS